MGIFSQNSGFVKFVNRALDVLLLNILWLAFSIPIITIGASTCAAFSVTLKMVDDEEGYVAKMFVKAFKENFKKGTLMWLISLPWLLLTLAAWRIVAIAQDYYLLIMIGAIFLTASYIAFNLYAYPLIARYDNSLKNMIKNSLGITLTHFGKTMLIVILVALEILIIIFNRYTLFVGILIGPEFIIYTISGISKRIFQQLDKQYEAAMKEEKARKELHDETVTAQKILEEKQNLQNDSEKTDEK